MTPIKTIPAAIILAGVLGAFNPLHPAHAHNQGAVLPEAPSLPRVHPIGVEEQPRWVLLAQMDDEDVEDITIPWWVGDEAIYIPDQPSSCILSLDAGPQV